MLPKSFYIVILCLIATSSLTTAAKRRQRLDTPIVKAAEAPLEDNTATASGIETESIKIEGPLANYQPQDDDMAATASGSKLATDVESSSSATSSTAQTSSVSADVTSAIALSLQADSEFDVDCDPDMVGFEIVTG